MIELKVSDTVLRVQGVLRRRPTVFSLEWWWWWVCVAKAP